MPLYVTPPSGSYPRVPKVYFFATTLAELHAAAAIAGLPADRLETDHFVVDLTEFERIHCLPDVLKVTMAQGRVMMRRLRETGEPGTPEGAYCWGQENPDRHRAASGVESPKHRNPEVQRQREIDMAYRQRDQEERAARDAVLAVPDVTR